MARFAAAFEALLTAAVERPGARLSDLALLGAAEEHQVLLEWNDERVSYPGGDFVHELFAAWAAAVPDSVAIVSPGQVLTYGELGDRAERLAVRLRDLGVRPESLVGIYVERSPEMVVGLLAILKAGGAYLPLDPSYPPERLAFMVEDAGVTVLLTERRLASSAPMAAASMVLVDELPVATGARLSPRESFPLAPEHPAYVIYTSGSTGRPKGVVVSHRSLANRLRFHAATDLDREARLLQKTSISFDVSLLETFGPLLAGGCMVQARPGGERDVTYLAGWIGAERITHTTFPPSLLAVLLEDESFAACDSLRIVVTGTEAVPADLPFRFHARFDADLYNRYGPTECTIAVTAWKCRPGEGERVLPIGRPIARAEVFLLDGNLRPVPLGTMGEIAIGGVCLARGYLARAEATAERFVPNPLPGSAPGARLYRTGDLARHRPDGAIEFLGRRDGQVKIRGFRVELGEIEAALAAHPRVGQGVVLAREDRPGEKRLVAYVVGAEGEDLHAHLRARLPEYMVPAAIVHLPSLPVTANGKVDRAALPAPNRSGGERESFEAPRTAGERLLAGIWTELLKADRVGVRDNFFELGGDSIQSIQLVARATRAGCRITPRQVFEHPVLGDLAAVAGSVEASRIDQGPVRGRLPLTPIQRRFLKPDPVDPDHFNQSVLLRPAQGGSAVAVRQAWTALLGHHDALRLRFVREAEGWRQWNEGLTGLAPSWTRVDLSGLPPGAAAASLADAGSRAQSSLDLARGPIARAVWIDLPGGETRLLLVIHHLAVDGVSWRVLLEDLSTAWSQLGSGSEVSLPEKTTSYQDWAELLVEHAAGWRPAAMAAELDFWRREEGAPLVALPVDFPGGGNRGAEARRVSVALAVEETQVLLQEVPAVYRTRIDDLLLTALARTFAGPGEALRVDLEGHGRDVEVSGAGGIGGVDLSRTVGWFTCIYPVRLEAGGSDVGAALQAVKEQLRSIPGRGIGWGLLRDRRALRPEADAAPDGPPPEISFNYLGQLDTALPEGSPFGVASEDLGPARSARAPRSHLLDVGGAVSGGRLRVTWIYSEGLHHRSTVEAWAERFLAGLRELIAHCLSRARRRLGGYTPGDFPLARLGQAELDRLLCAEWGIEDVYPLTPLQEGLLFETLLTPGSGVYVGQLLCRLAGRIDEEALEEACRFTFDQHAALRTSFHAGGEARPMQVVHGRIEKGLERLDWRGLPAAERERRLAALLAADRERGFDPSRAPLMRWTLARTGEDERWLLWTSHHLLVDGWSFSAVTGDLLNAYRALLVGEPPRKVRRRPFRDYIAWLESRDRTATESYWRRALAGWSEPTPLFDGLGRGRGSGRKDHRLPEALTAALERQARRHQLTLNTLVQASWGLLLGRSAGVDDVVFGATVSGRPAELPGVEEMVGLFINTLPVRLRLAEGGGEPRLLAWLQDLQRAQVELRQYEHSPLIEVRSASGVPRGQALFGTIFVFESYPIDESIRQAADGEGGLGIAEVRAIEQPHYPLNLMVAPGKTLRLGISYDQARFDEVSILRVLSRLEILLDSMARSLAAGGEVPLSGLTWLSAGERRQVVAEWNDTALPESGMDAPGAGIQSFFETQAARTPAAPAVEMDGSVLLYRTVEEGANQLARRLLSLGVGPEWTVGICLERSLDLPLAVLAVLKAGGAYVPLDPAYPAERLQAMAGEARLGALITVSPLLGLLPPGLGEGRVPLVLLDRESAAIAAQSGQRPPLALSERNLAYVLFTSGSTGRPKGIAMPHRPLANLIRWQLARLAPGRRTLQFASLSFDVSCQEIFATWGSGGCLVLVADPMRRDAFALLRLLAERQVERLFLPFVALQQLAEAAAESVLLPPLREVMTAGEQLQATGPVIALFGRLSGGRLENQYGPD